MRILRIFLYEVITALALLGFAYVYVTAQMLLPFAKVMVIALYVLVALATEAVIASSLRPEMWRVLGLNLLVAAIISVPGWTSNSSLKIFASIAVTTLALRTLVAEVSLRGSKVQVRRIAAALVGATLLLETLATMYSTGERIYFDYFFYPKVKDGYILPTRWQDFVGHGVFLGGAILVVYFSYRLLKYAFRGEGSVIV